MTPQESENSKVGNRWLAILVTAVLTGAVTIGVTLLLGKVQSSTGLLEYELTSGLGLKVGDEWQAIHNVRLVNSGDTNLRGVRAVIKTGGSELRTHLLDVPATLMCTAELAGQSIEIACPNLLRGESISLSFLLASPGKQPDTPVVDARSDDLLGTEKESGPPIDGKEALLPQLAAPLISVYAALLAMLALRRRAHKAKSPLIRVLSARIGMLEDSETHSDDQRRILSYVFGLYGFIDEAQELLQRSDETNYWAEVDLIVNRALANKSKEEIEVLTSALESLLGYAAISSSSEALIHFNLMRLYESQGDVEEAEKHHMLASDLSPLRVAAREKLHAEAASSLASTADHAG